MGAVQAEAKEGEEGSDGDCVVDALKRARAWAAPPRGPGALTLRMPTT